MIGFEERLRSELEALVPLPSDAGASWEDALRRATLRPTAARRRDVVRYRVALLAAALAALAALAVSPVGGAIVRSFGDFSAWLTGSPGEPASESAQKAFDEANERSWAKFPDSPKLRRLLVTRAAGGTFELFGFRSGDSLCLRLTVKGMPADEKDGTGCTPLAALRAAEAPAVITLIDYSFGREDVRPNNEGLTPARASASFGVVADGVEGVDLTTNHGKVDAQVGSNAFLAVTAHPPLGLRTRELTATTVDGDKLAVPVAEAPFADYGLSAKPGVAPGPTQIERVVEGGTIGWLLHGEPRGKSLTEAGLNDEKLFPPFPGQHRDVRFARVVKPDPKGLRVVVVGLVHFDKSARYPTMPAGDMVCTNTLMPGFGGGGGCSRIDDLFNRGPFSYSLGGNQGGDQYALVSGLASDDVARMELFLAAGEQLAVPLRDNVYAIDVARLKFPIRLVAFNGDDRVIGIWTYAHDPLADPGPRPIEGKQRVTRRVRAADGSLATLRLGPSTAGTTCWQIEFRDGHGSGGCQQKQYRGPALALSVDSAGVVEGTASPSVATVELTLRNGQSMTVEPVQGVVLQSLTPAQADAGGPELAIGLDGSGQEVGRQRFERNR
jgi:hypothetical protein